MDRYAVAPAIVFLIANSLLYASTRLALAKPPPWSMISEQLEREPSRSKILVALLVASAVVIVCCFAVAITLQLHQVSVTIAGVILIPVIAVRLVHGRPMRALVMAALAGLLGAWLCAPNWLTTDLLAALILVGLAVNLQFRASFRTVAIIGAIWAAYDAVQVFLTKAMLAIASASISTWTPEQFVVPGHLSLNSHPLRLLGLADILVPGLLVLAAGRISRNTDSPKLYRSALWGYAIGLAIAIVVEDLTNALLPALVFLIPAVVATVVLSARRNHMLNELTSRLPAFR